MNRRTIHTAEGPRDGYFQCPVPSSGLDEKAHEKAPLQREMDATDRQIDRLVYDLYWLTEEEVRIVEGATAR